MPLIKSLGLAEQVGTDGINYAASQSRREREVSPRGAAAAAAPSDFLDEL